MKANYKFSKENTLDTNFAANIQLIEQRRGYRPFLIWMLLYSPEDITDDDLNVKGSLDVENASIKSLSKGVSIGLNLYLCNTPIEFLPDDLKVGGVLNISDTLIKSLPEGLKVREFIYVDYDKF